MLKNPEKVTRISMQTLSHAEAIPLAQLLTTEAAKRVGARCLLIKGATLDWHGLRPPRIPADVDLLVAPDEVEPFIDQLEEWGWYVRLGPFTDYPFPHHAVTLIHDQWPCDIDVHRRFPGFLRDPADVFDVLWGAEGIDAGRQRIGEHHGQDVKHPGHGLE